MKIMKTETAAITMMERMPECNDHPWRECDKGEPEKENKGYSPCV